MAYIGIRPLVSGRHPSLPQIRLCLTRFTNSYGRMTSAIRRISPSPQTVLGRRPMTGESSDCARRWPELITVERLHKAYASTVGVADVSFIVTGRRDLRSAWSWRVDHSARALTSCAHSREQGCLGRS